MNKVQYQSERRESPRRVLESVLEAKWLKRLQQAGLALTENTAVPQGLSDQITQESRFADVTFSCRKTLIRNDARNADLSNDK